MNLRPKLQPLPLCNIQLADRFWLPKIRQLAEVTLPAQFEKLALETGRLENFRRVAARRKGQDNGGHQGRYYDDSDVYKWCEASALALAQIDSPTLKQQLDEVVEAIVSAQDSDGYLVTFFQLEHPEMKFRNLSYMHEMYCMGHLMEAGAALDEAMGDRRLLDCAVRTANLLIARFGEGHEVGYCGHSEVEYALLRLGRYLDDPRYLALAERMLRLRGTRPSRFEQELSDDEAMALSPWARQYLNLRGEYFQDHAPLPEHTEIVGHAVRGMYLYRAAVALHNEPEWEAMLRRVWQNLVERRLYVTGGTGSSPKNEGFTRDYDLPNLDSYAETCAAVALVLWGQELTQAFGESDFMDVAELALYNAALAGISEDGTNYFYANPLESRGHHTRVPWFDCACCPPNIARLIGSVATLAVFRHTSDTGASIQLPLAGRFDVGPQSSFEIESDYPRTGKFIVRWIGGQAQDFDLRIRIPGWVDEMSAEIENTPFEADFESGYAIFRRQWMPGDVLRIEWEMEPRWLESHPLVLDNIGCSALAHGPLVYCLESLTTDHPAQHFVATTDAPIEVGTDSHPLGPELVVNGFRLTWDGALPLYGEALETAYEEASERFVPYASWGNRGPSTMQVWVRSMVAGEED